MSTLTKALQLDAAQARQIRKVLEDQRDQVQRIWNNTAIPAAYRINATKGISEQAADQIRAVLNDEQKKKFNPPRKQDPAPGSGDRTVEEWMSAVNVK